MGLLMVAVAATFATTGPLTVREFGIGVAIAVPLYVLRLRPVLPPAAIEALGGRAWWPTRVGSMKLRMREQQRAPMAGADDGHRVELVVCAPADSLADTTVPEPMEEEIR